MADWSEAVDAYVSLARGRQTEQRLTTEIIEGVGGNGTYTVRGVSGIPTTGQAALTIGQRVAVAWRDKKPFTIIAHQARRAQFGPQIGTGVPGIVEILFLDENGDVAFRNDEQVTVVTDDNERTVKQMLSSFGAPKSVKWGDDRASFVVMTLKMIANPWHSNDPTNQPEEIGVPVYHVFTFDRPDEKTVLGNSSPAGLVLSHSYDPSESSIALISGVDVSIARTAYVTTYRVVGLNMANAPGELLQTLDVSTSSSFAFTFDGLSLGQAIKGLENGNGNNWQIVNEQQVEFGSLIGGGVPPWAGTRITDIRLDARHHLYVMLRGRFFGTKVSTVSVSGTKRHIGDVADGCVLTTEAASGAISDGQSVGFFEPHVWLIDLTAEAVAWSTSKAAPESVVVSKTQALGASGAAGSLDPNAPIAISPLGGDDPQCVGIPAPETQDHYDSPPPFTFGVNIPIDVAGTQGTERNLDAWWREALPFLDPTQLDPAPAASSSTLTRYEGLIGGDAPDPDGPGGDPDPPPAYGSIYKVDWTLHTNQVPATFRYRVRRAYLLHDSQSGGTAAPRVFLVVDRIKRTGTTTFDADIAAFVLQGDTLIMTAQDWTPFQMQRIIEPDYPFEEDEAESDAFNDGTDIEVLSITGQLILWRKTTRGDRDAQISGEVWLTSLELGESVQVGTDAFRVINREIYLLRPKFIYEAEEADGRRFLQHKDPDTGAITLDTDNPVEDEALALVKTLRDLDDATLTAIEGRRAHFFDPWSEREYPPTAQAINDEAVLGGAFDEEEQPDE